jgi:hypothetical protein
MWSDVNARLSFESDIRPLFREADRDAMEFAFDLWSHEDVSRNAREILSRLQNGSMPCDVAWPPDRVMVFESWVNAGKPA